jgi:histidine ammonia-lyase
MITIGLKNLCLCDFEKLLIDREQIYLNESAVEELDKSFQFLAKFINNKIIYGINTGFGPMAQFAIPPKELSQLQYNLIRSHSCGTGDSIDHDSVLASMIVRLASIMQGYSGVHPKTAFILRDFINVGIIPFVPNHGGVGASGDLIQLAHIALNLLGEGEVYFNGELQPAKKVLQENNIDTLEIFIREGLALTNGTSVMTGISVVNLLNTSKLLNWSIIATSFLIEIVQGYDDFFSEELNAVKHHEGQIKIAEMLRNILIGSQLTKKRPDHLYNGITESTIIIEKVQDNYSIRCTPQILGPIYDALQAATKVVLNEVNSVSDNPIINRKGNDVLHGGNFHGDYISFEMDKLKIAVTKLSILIERQLNYLLNDKLNTKLPPFVNLGVLGLNLGMQGMQFTATSTTAENQTLSFPMYIHSIPCNNDNQDVVSMGTNSALFAQKVIENTFEVLSIHFITILQSIDCLGIYDQLSPIGKKIYLMLREVVPVFYEDTPKYNEIKSMKNLLMKNKPVPTF